MESFQKRDRERRKREKRQEKEAKRRERGTLEPVVDPETGLAPIPVPDGDLIATEVSPAHAHGEAPSP